MLDWTPVVFVAFKALVLGIGMFYAIKWHYDQGKKEKAMEKRALLRASGKVAVAFTLTLLGLGIVTFVLASRLGLDLTFP
ncbi:hypothetical protein F506_00030 [Herbaspirillum hiltneri N3]|uniref:Uncharacterized protein n=1 Tax=Herbaspirillum hiltneri N3 TaxID=1262470 RepID=A0ABN4HRC2_9BURK|nr:hypothetical protein [Herbaspirillum hiltneri]AKZ61265.1 hypothetical protein F506_00030 [Herbaspirillum hiltneri N3]